MKTKTPPAVKSKKAATPTDAPKQTPIGISPAQGKALQRCADRCGQTVETFVRAMILDGLEKLDGLDPLAMPCPFCRKTDDLEILHWSTERWDGTEYDGDAVRCNCCTAIATVAAWIMRGLSVEHARPYRKGEFTR